MPLSKDIEDPLFECLNLDSKASALPTAQFNKYNVESKQNHAMQSVYKLDYDQKLTSRYCDTMTHIVKGNVGAGILAMGMAFRNGGLLFSTITWTFLGIVSCYNQHLLVQIANTVKDKHNIKSVVSFGETVGLAFQEGPDVFKYSSDFIRRMIKICIIVSQFGFCCVYFLFISQSLEQLCACYDVKVNLHVLMVHVLPVILATALIRELKYIAPLSTLANLSTFIALSLILYRSVTGLSSISERKLIGKWEELALSFGTMVFSLEGITMTLPLQQNMKRKEKFLGPCGVLNVSFIFVLCLTEIVGFFGYYKFGEDVKESLTLNLEVKSSIMAQGVIVLIMLGILSSYVLQFFVLISMFLPSVKKKSLDWPYYSWHMYEYLLRGGFVLLTFLMAQVIPHLDLIVSLLGSIGGTLLAFLYPPLADISIRKRHNRGILSWRIIVDIISIVIALLGCLVGTTISVKGIKSAIEASFNI